MSSVTRTRSLQATGSQKKESGRVDSSKQKAFSGKPRSLLAETGKFSASDSQSAPNALESQRKDPEPEGAVASSSTSAIEQATQVQASAAPDFGAKSQKAGEQADEQVQIAVIQLYGAPETCKEVLKKMLSNILRQPEDPKFRKVRLANPRIKETVVEVEGALELLQVFQTLQTV